MGRRDGSQQQSSLPTAPFTSYERDANSGDDAMMRRYQSAQSRFNQPDPYDGSYDLTNPQSLNRYAYTQNDPVNFVDPSGLFEQSPDDRIVTDTWARFDPWSLALFWRYMFWSPGIGTGGPTTGDFPGTDPQDTSQQQTPYPGCITANWFVNTPQAKAVFDDYWRRSQQSGRENGGWFFYEPKTNSLMGVSASEGERFGMPNEEREFVAQMNQFRQNERSVIYMFDFHTHPSGNGRPSGNDVGNINNTSRRQASIQAQGGGHAPIGIIISGPGKITLYDANGLVNEFNRLNECL